MKQQSMCHQCTGEHAALAERKRAERREDGTVSSAWSRPHSPVHLPVVLPGPCCLPLSLAHSLSLSHRRSVSPCSVQGIPSTEADRERKKELFLSGRLKPGAKHSVLMQTCVSTGKKQNRLQDLTGYPAKAGEIQAISCCLVCVPSRLINEYTECIFSLPHLPPHPSL